MKGTAKYEVFREMFAITEWRDGCVYRTESLGCDWFPMGMVELNLPRVTHIMFVPVSTSHPMAGQSTIRSMWAAEDDVDFADES